MTPVAEPASRDGGLAASVLGASRPRVLIVGGGMGGIAAAKALARVPVEVTLVDSHNYYLFQPLLYEVAGAIVNIEDVTHTLRGLLRGQRNTHVRLADATAVDLERRQLLLEDGERLPYDFLILATGLRADADRVPGAKAFGFPLKTLEDALGIRNHLLRRLETVATHPELVSAGALDIVVVGGGTTGVEVVAAFSEIYNHALREEFPELDFAGAKITLLEAGETLLPAFHPDLRRWVQRELTKKGTDVRLHSPVAEIGPASVTLADGEEIAAGTVVVATGVRATPLADTLGVAQAPSGRVLVEANLSLPGQREVFAIGDMAALPSPDGGLHPALAQFAMQGGRHVAREIERRLVGKPPRRFHYWDKGMTSMVGYGAAVLQSGPIRLRGALAMFLWGVLHGYYVPGFRNRLSLRVTWLWSLATRRRAALLLIDETGTPRLPLAPPAAPQPKKNAAPSSPGRRCRDMEAQTDENLITALHGEAFAYARYSLFAEAARKHGDPQLATMFDALASVELSEHFSELADLAGLIGTDADNLRAAIADEDREAKTTYPAFAEQARKAGAPAVAARFKELADDECEHAQALELVLEESQVAAIS